MSTRCHGVPADEVAEQVNDNFCLLQFVPCLIMQLLQRIKLGRPVHFAACVALLVSLSECVCVLPSCYQLPVYRSGCLSLYLLSTWSSPLSLLRPGLSRPLHLLCSVPEQPKTCSIPEHPAHCLCPALVGGLRHRLKAHRGFCCKHLSHERPRHGGTVN